MTTSEITTLYTLGDRGQTIDGSANDVRGREVKDNRGTSIGTVADLLIDDQEHKIRFLVVEHDGFLDFGGTKTRIPIDAITKTTEHDVYINQTREQVASVPAYTPDLANRQYRASIYNHFGFDPYWSQGYAYVP